MDPVRTVQLFQAAVSEGNCYEAAGIAEDYQTWVDHGGFLATGEHSTKGHCYIVKLDIEQDRIGCNTDHATAIEGYVEFWISAAGHYLEIDSNG